ncbi:hypothetical protein BpHYR1_050535 [Brachionus plicatilis]|uniref:Uncharacterized protein n=1 Tax=Brachionus plicatilis TaxID=10195 RepID=A0A3M7P3T7_BRAPC|nr:hypothetical protein BpHYR1_050535 [Brachionus plicatilis]
MSLEKNAFLAVLIAPNLDTSLLLIANISKLKALSVNLDFELDTFIFCLMLSDLIEKPLLTRVGQNSC